MFNSFAASDTMRGDSGNDDFYSYGGVGNDVMVSATNDADRFYFDASTVTRSD